MVSFAFGDKELGHGTMRIQEVPGIFRKLLDDVECPKEVLIHVSLLARERPTPPSFDLMKEL